MKNWNGLAFHIGRRDEARELVLKYHYSRRWPANVQMIGTLHEAGGLFGDSGQPVAALTISIPSTRWTLPVLELTRLVRRDDAEGVPLTRLISLSLNAMKFRGGDLIVSFADKMRGHHGGVYRAASWNYHGQRDPSTQGILFDGKFVPGRTCNSLYGTRSPKKLAVMFPNMEVLPFIDEGKHLYWKALTKSGIRKARALELRSIKWGLK